MSVLGFSRECSALGTMSAPPCQGEVLCCWCSQHPTVWPISMSSLTSVFLVSVMLGGTTLAPPCQGEVKLTVVSIQISRVWHVVLWAQVGASLWRGGCMHPTVWAPFDQFLENLQLYLTSKGLLSCRLGGKWALRVFNTEPCDNIKRAGLFLQAPCLRVSGKHHRWKH